MNRKERFLQLKSDLRLTAEEVAELTGRSADTVRGYTSTEVRRQPPLDVIEKLKNSFPAVLVSRHDDGSVSVMSSAPVELVYVEGAKVQSHIKSGRTQNMEARITKQDVMQRALLSATTPLTFHREDDFMKGDPE